MERIWLGVLYLSGWHISTCLSHQYHFVADAKNWTDAQTYCRQTYKDLATIQNNDELNEFISTLSSAGYNNEVWIGLYDEIDWMWSDGYTWSAADYQTWTNGEPNFYDADEFCVNIESDGTFNNYFCTDWEPFICYHGTQTNPIFVFVNILMDWSSAQSYCRQYYNDLATVTSYGNSQVIGSIMPSGAWAWIGLYRNPDFFWSDGSSFLYNNFYDGANQIFSLTVTCGYSSLLRSGTWNFWSCKTTLPFICYDDPPSLHRQILNLRIDMDPSLELNMTVKEDLLKMLQERLTKKGVSGGVTLKWREQSDGTVFHKDDDIITSSPSCQPIF